MTIYVTGDIHGCIADVKSRIAAIQEPTENDIIVVCGDAGLEYGNHIMGSVKKEMKKFPGTWIIMRGNHDTRYWRDHKNQDGWHIQVDDFDQDSQYLIQDKYPNIWYIKDEGGIYNIQRKKFLFIPGAYSVDKFYRIENNYPYEPEEQLTYSEFIRLFNNMQDWIFSCLSIDYVISHTCPLNLELYIRDLFMDSVKQTDVDKTTEKWLNEFQKLLEPEIKGWIFGHYHSDRTILDKYHMVFNRVLEIGKDV